MFGSWVRGDQKEASDIDVLVDFDRRVDLFDIMELQWFWRRCLAAKWTLLHVIVFVNTLDSIYCRKWSFYEKRFERLLECTNGSFDRHC